jgi:hypothetical protein
MPRPGIFLAFCMLISMVSYGQTAPAPTPPATSPAPTDTEKSLGSYSLVVTALEPSPATHLLNPPLVIQLEGGTPLEPRERSGTETIASQYAIEGFGSPRYECTAINAHDHGCDALDRSNFLVRDANTLEYHLANHGSSIRLEVNLQVHDLLPVSQAIMQASWHPHEVIFVSVPKPSPSFRFVSAALVGDWNGNAVVFEPGKPLPESAKKALEDLGVHQDLGDKMLYSYRVKEPKNPK